MVNMVIDARDFHIKRIVFESDRGRYVLEGEELELWLRYVNNAVVLAQLHGMEPSYKLVVILNRMEKALRGELK